MKLSKMLALLLWCGLSACTDANPVVSSLRGSMPNSSSPTNPTDKVATNGSYIKTDQASAGQTTTTSGYSMQVSVSKGDSQTVQTNSGQYKLILDESTQ